MPLPMKVNIPVDIVVGLYVLGFATSAINGASHGGYCDDYQRTPADLEECEQWKLWFGPLVLAFIIGSLLLG